MARAYAGPPRILVGYDGSDDAYAALTFAVREAQADEAEVVLVYAVDDTVLNSVWGVVFDPEEIKNDAANMLTAAVEEIVALDFEESRVRTEVVLGNPASALTKYSDWATYIIVGRCSVGKGESEFVGSTAVGVAGAARCPVIVVSANDEPPEQPYGRIGVGVNISAKGRAGLPFAMEEALRRNARLSVISVVRSQSRSRWRSGPQLTQEQRDEAVDVTRIRTESIVRSLTQKHPGVESDIEISFGSPVDVLVRRSRELDLLVVEVQSSFPNFAVGGVARGVMAHGHCPVALVRSKDVRTK
ncbi:MAG: universal stress protein [Propionibacteriaceae bacterium]|nr:universal stress protein [Propionibacteriaceae bacterium]